MSHTVPLSSSEIICVTIKQTRLKTKYLNLSKENTSKKTDYLKNLFPLSLIPHQSEVIVLKMKAACEEYAT